MIASFYYLATPYSKYPAGKETAVLHAAEAASLCFQSGILVFSPIAHTHVIAEAGGLPGDFRQWAEFDKTMISASSGMIVVKMDGWDESEGILAEIEICRSLNKPIYYMNPDGPVPQVRIS